ncbi:MAG: hypothetical protein KUL87_09135 [Pseudomonas sp.]|nr:hypothetical protein [Pseudomonas sp.]
MSKVLVDRELPEPYGWIAVGELYMIRENAIRAAGKTSCIGVYTRPQLLAALSAVTAERDRLREERDSQQRMCIAEMEKVSQLRAEVERLRAFSNEIVSGAFEGGSFDGGDIQDMGVRHGLLRIEQREDECGEVCACREYGFPSECYRKTELLRAAMAAKEA